MTAIPPPPEPGSARRWRYTLASQPHDRDVLSARLWLAGALGVWEQPNAVVAWFDQQSDSVPAGGAWSAEPAVDWQAGWKATIEPVIAGPIVIVPSWLAEQFVPPAGVETVVVLDPGQAFGSGHHATTTLCAEYLGELDLVGASVFDVGTGTGVLAIIAALRGADDVVAVDVDPHAVEIAAANAVVSGVEVRVARGSANAEDRTFDVVVANLVTDVVTALGGGLAARVRPGGWLVVSGIDAQRAHAPRGVLEAAGLVLHQARVRDGWVGDLWSRPVT